MANLYDIYFAGQLVDGYGEEQVRNSLTKLFKADEKTINTLFSGRQVPIKKGVDKDAALKYKTTLHQAGAVAIVRAASQPPVAKPDTEVPKPEAY